jgi:predicted acylesterase/phospholipase RssA
MATQKELGPRARYDTDYVNEEHIQVFRDALNYDDHVLLIDYPISRSSSLVSMNMNGSTGVGGLNSISGGVETITSQSDWTPVYNKTRKRSNFTSDIKSPLLEQSGDEKLSQKPDSSASSMHNFSHGNNIDDFSLTFTILRYPLLTFILCWTTILSFLYFIVRLSIAFSENLLLLKDKKRSNLVKNLKNSANYNEYIENSKKLDSYLGLNEWCNEDRYKYYDWRNLRRTINNLKKLRHAKKYEDLMVVLQTCVKSNFAGTENPLMYSHCYYGTKKLIEKYNTEVVKCLNLIIESKEINRREKRIFFKIVNKNFGRTCLVLSGGASFCYNHFGVIKALIENDCMPKILSGTSGGGMIAALAATRYDDELLELIKPKLACKIDAFDDEPMWKWIKRWWETGARFDSVEWAKKAQWWTTGSTTFEESYKKTGKILNISTVPNDIHSPTILCNYITSPNCCIWSAMLASAAVPGILNPVMLMEKTKNNSIRPFSLGSKWKDGSLRTDVPLSTLNMYFNTKFSIVSQVNPHVMLWIFKNRGDIGKPIVRSRGKTFRGGFILSYLENLIKLEIIKWLKLVKEFQLFPNLLESDWSNLFLQNFGGTITLFPKIILSDYMYILSDPTEERLARIIKNGETVTYPKLLFIKHRLNIERTIEKGLEDSKIDIDTTFNAPPDLVKHIIENDKTIKEDELSNNNFKKPFKFQDDDSSSVINTKETIHNDKQVKYAKMGYKSDEGEDLITDEAEIDDEYEEGDADDDEDIEVSDNIQGNGPSNKTDLGFLGIRIGITPENLSEESYDEQYGSS